LVGLTDMNDDAHSKATSTKRSPARYGPISVAMPVVGVLAVAVFLWICGAEGHWYWTWRGVAAMCLLAGSCLLGVIAAFIAWVRAERFSAFIVAGFVLNAPLLLLLLGSALSHAITWLRYG
jgi:hypothetical protein